MKRISRRHALRRLGIAATGLMFPQIIRVQVRDIVIGFRPFEIAVC